jgi:ATP-binding cassette subfamily B protein
MKDIVRILKVAKELWRYYALVSVASILIAVLNLFIPLLTGRAIDEIQSDFNGNVQFAVFLALGIFAVDLGVTLISNFGGYFGDQMSVRLQKILSDRYFSHLMTLPQTYFDTELSGKIISRLNRSIVQISNFMQMMSNNFLQFIFSTILSLAVIAYFSWPIALMLGTLYPIYIFMTVRTSNTWLKYQAQKNENTDIANGRFAEAISQMKVVKSFNQERRELDFFRKYFNKVIQINRPQSAFWHKQDVKRRVILNLIFLGVYVYIFAQGASGNLTAGEAVTLLLYAMQIRIPIFTISFLVENTQKAVADSKDYFEVLSEESHDVWQSKKSPLKLAKGEIIFKDVSFEYEKNQAVLKNLNFKVEHGQTVALVGESGGGKTTITNLLMRLYETSSGEILFDNQDISKVSLGSLRQNVGVVFQEPALFSGTIKENIAYSNPAASDKAIINAAKAANAHEFIQDFKEGYESQIGERGLKLSGGQKQRIAIARALLKNAPILILDEATSNLDNHSERLVQEALDNLMRNRTTIIIAHRLSTIQKVDCIITLKDGHIDEIGTPASLANTNGVYANLLKLQGLSGEAAKEALKEYDIKG